MDQGDFNAISLKWFTKNVLFKQSCASFVISIHYLITTQRSMRNLLLRAFVHHSEITRPPSIYPVILLRVVFVYQQSHYADQWTSDASRRNSYAQLYWEYKRENITKTSVWIVSSPADISTNRFGFLLFTLCNDRENICAINASL